ncbi:MAG TPA: acyl-CoA dehydrogenase family protein, partial [Acidimicrobiales bacterium]|nr:acyl-CoA dehydrogenase family protein [Acidimicrobiales bacterium]
MAIDFTFPPDVEDVRLAMRALVRQEVAPAEERLVAEGAGRAAWRAELDRLRGRARELGLWLPHMPRDWGGAGLGPTALAAVSAEAAGARFGGYVVNCYAPDEGNMHTLLHFGTPDQHERYLRPLCEGTARSCFAMTEPEVAGSDPTLMQTRAELEGDEWVVNGHKWFISGARGAKFAILLARTEDDPEVPQAATTAFIVDTASPGWEVVRDIETMSGSHNHCEIRITDLRVPAANLLGGRGQGHRLGPARLAHCMRWLGQAESALDLMVERATERYSHGSVLADKQG